MWNWLIYAALIAGAVATFAALALLVVRLLQAWRAFKRLRRHVFKELDIVADKVEATLDKLESASDTEELDRSLGHLHRSLAELAVLRAAWDEATAFTALLPRK